MGSSFSSTPGPKTLEQVASSKASKQRARQALETCASWRQTIVIFSDSLDKCCFAAALWAEDERDIPFSKAFKNLSLTASELSIVSREFLESIDAHACVLSRILALQREHHDAVKRVARQQKIFRDIKLKLETAQFIKRSHSTLNLQATRIKDKEKIRRYVDPEEIFTGVDTLDFASQINARALLDELIHQEQEKWNKLNHEREDKLVEAFHALFMAESDLWTKFSIIFERMRRICSYYCKQQDLANAVGGKKALVVDGIESKNMTTRRKSITNNSDQAFASKQQKLLIFQNPETNIQICKKRLKLLKRWHYLTQTTLQLWLDLREYELRHVKACIEWLMLDGECHKLVRSFTYYDFADGTSPVNPESKRDYLSMLHGWAEILKTGQGGIERPNHLNIAKPLSVVQNCLQYVERTVYNVNEREKTALDQVQKLATATAEKKSFFGKKANAPVDLDSRRISVIGHGRQIAPESNHAAELLRHKLDKVLIDNRIFRRTKLIKCQMELWRGLEFCTKFMGTLYVYLGSEHKEKVPVRLVGNDQGLLKFGLSPKGSVTLGDINSHGTSVTEMVSPTTQLFDNFVSATEGISSVSMDVGTLQLESPMSSVSDPFQTYEQLVQPKDLTNIQTVKEQRKLGTSSLTSVSTAPPTKGLSLKERIANRLTKSMIKIHPMPIPQVDSEEEFAGLTKKDEADMRSQASLLMSQIEPASLKGNDQIRNSLGKLLNLNSTQASNLNEEDLVTTVQNKEDVPSVFVIPGSNMDISEDGPMDIPVYESIEYTPKPPSPEPKIRVQVPSIELSEASTGCALQLAIDQTPIETSSLPTSPQTGEPKKKAKKKKRHSSKPPKEAENAVSPSAPPAELVIDENGNSIPIPITSPTKQRRSRHSSSRKKEKGPPPPPPLNPSAIGGNLEALPEPSRTPSLVVSSASMTNTRLVTALSNGDIKLSDAIPIPNNLSSSNLSMDTPSSNHSFVSTASAEPPSAPPSQTVTAKSPSPPPQIVNILENELKAMAPRAISPEAFEAENSQQIQQTNTKPKYTEMDSSEVKYPKLPGLSRVSTALPANSSHSLPDSKETVKRRPPPDPPKDSPATIRRNFNRKSSDEIIIPKYLANETVHTPTNNSCRSGSGTFPGYMTPPISHQQTKVSTSTDNTPRSELRKKSNVSTHENALASGGARVKSQIFNVGESSNTAASYVLHTHLKKPEPPKQPYPGEGTKGNTLGVGGLRHLYSSSKGALSSS